MCRPAADKRRNTSCRLTIRAVPRRSCGRNRRTRSCANGSPVSCPNSSSCLKVLPRGPSSCRRKSWTDSFVFAGHIFVTKHKEYVFGASQVLYYSLTTLSRLLTLGEEYTRIIQVGKSGRLVPTFSVSHLKRFVLFNRIIYYTRFYKKKKIVRSKAWA